METLNMRISIKNLLLCGGSGSRPGETACSCCSRGARGNFFKKREEIFRASGSRVFREGAKAEEFYTQNRYPSPLTPIAPIIINKI